MVSSDPARTDATRIDVLVADMVAAFVRSGGVWGDSAVVSVRVVVELDTGETLRTTHRRSIPLAPPEQQLTPLQRRIVDALAASAVPLKRLALAKLLGRNDVHGSFGQSVAQLVKSGVIYSHDGKVADDESKFSGCER